MNRCIRGLKPSGVIMVALIAARLTRSYSVAHWVHLYVLSVLMVLPHLHLRIEEFSHVGLDGFAALSSAQRHD